MRPCLQESGESRCARCRRARSRLLRAWPPRGRGRRPSPGSPCWRARLAFPAREQPSGEEVGHREHEEQTVETIENAAVSGNDARAVLDSHFTLEERLRQIADLRRDADDRPEENESPGIELEAQLRRRPEHPVAE